MAFRVSVKPIILGYYTLKKNPFCSKINLIFKNVISNMKSAQSGLMVLAFGWESEFTSKELGTLCLKLFNLYLWVERLEGICPINCNSPKEAIIL